MRVGTIPITEKQTTDRAGLGDIGALVASRGAGVRSTDKQASRSDTASAELGGGQLGSRGKDRFGIELAQKRERIDRADERIAREKIESARTAQDSSRLESRRQERTELRESAGRARQERLQELDRLQDRERLSQSERLEQQARTDEAQREDDQPEEVDEAGRDAAFDELIKAQHQRGAIDGVSDELGLIDTAAAALAAAQAEGTGDELVSNVSAELLQNASESGAEANPFGLAGFGSANGAVIPRWAEPGAFGKLGNTTPGGSKAQAAKLEAVSALAQDADESASSALSNSLQDSEGGQTGFDLAGLELLAGDESFQTQSGVNASAAAKQAEAGKASLVKELGAEANAKSELEAETDAILAGNQSDAFEETGGKSSGEQQTGQREQASELNKPSRLSRDEASGGLFEASAKAKGKEDAKQENGRSDSGSSSGPRFSNQTDQQNLVRDVAKVFGSGALGSDVGTGANQQAFLSGKGFASAESLTSAATSTSTGEARSALPADLVPTNAAQLAGVKAAGAAASGGGIGADLQTKLAEAAAGFGEATGAEAAESGDRESAFLRANVGGLVTGVKGQLMPGGGKMTLQLDPPELGVLQVKLEMKDGLATVSCGTSSDEASEVLSHSLSKLKNALEASGLTVERMAVERTVVSQSTGAERGSNERGSNDRPNPEGRGLNDLAGQAGGREESGSGQKARDEATDRAWRAIYGDPLDVLG